MNIEWGVTRFPLDGNSLVRDIAWYNCYNIMQYDATLHYLFEILNLIYIYKWLMLLQVSDVCKES